MLVRHEFRHKLVNARADDLLRRKAEHLLYVSGDGGNDSHRAGVHQRLDHAGPFVVDEVAELLEAAELFILKAVVDILQVLPQILADVDEADLGEVENEQQIELFAFAKFQFELFIDAQDSPEKGELVVATYFELADPAKSPRQVLPFFAARFNISLYRCLDLLPHLLQLEQVLGLDRADFYVLKPDEVLDFCP